MQRLTPDLLAALRARRQELAESLAQLDTALRVVEGMVEGLENRVQVLPGQTVHQAAEAVLSQVGRPMAGRELLKVLMEGGVRCRAKDPLNSLNTILGQHRDTFERQDGTWRLRSWRQVAHHG